MTVLKDILDTRNEHVYRIYNFVYLEKSVCTLSANVPMSEH